MSSGWLMSLRDEERSDWGDVGSFFESISSAAAKEQRFLIDSTIWGLIVPGAPTPKRGDGFAFYHSTRASFERPDPFGGRPRISLFGVLEDLQFDGRHLESLKVWVEARVLKAMRYAPVVRDENTRALFNAAGIVAGHPSTLYHAPSHIWKELRALGPK